MIRRNFAGMIAVAGIVAFALAAVFSCNGKKLKSVEISGAPQTEVIYIGDAFDMEASVSGAAEVDCLFEWSISPDTGIIESADEADGKSFGITAKTVGSAKVSVRVALKNDPSNSVEKAINLTVGAKTRPSSGAGMLPESYLSAAQQETVAASGQVSWELDVPESSGLETGSLEISAEGGVTVALGTAVPEQGAGVIVNVKDASGKVIVSAPVRIEPLTLSSSSGRPVAPGSNPMASGLWISEKAADAIAAATESGKFDRYDISYLEGSGLSESAVIVSENGAFSVKTGTAIPENGTDVSVKAVDAQGRIIAAIAVSLSPLTVESQIGQVGTGESGLESSSWIPEQAQAALAAAVQAGVTPTYVVDIPSGTGLTSGDVTVSADGKLSVADDAQVSEGGASIRIKAVDSNGNVIAAVAVGVFSETIKSVDLSAVQDNDPNPIVETGSVSRFKLSITPKHDKTVKSISASPEGILTIGERDNSGRWLIGVANDDNEHDGKLVTVTVAYDGEPETTQLIDVVVSHVVVPASMEVSNAYVHTGSSAVIQAVYYDSDRNDITSHVTYPEISLELISDVGNVMSQENGISGATVRLNNSANVGNFALLEASNAKYSALESVEFTVNCLDMRFVPGLFTIGISHDNTFRKVIFPKGNLYHIGTDPDNGWNFEAHQYDYRTRPGSEAIINGAAANTPDNNCGLFYWSPDNSGSYANDYDSSNQLADDVLFAHVPDFMEVSEFDFSALDKDEWTYVLDTRKDAAEKYGLATLNIGNVTMYGAVILPDLWIKPENCDEFVPGVTGTSADWSASWTANVYDANQWQAMEDSGAVFLPTSGQKYYGNGNVIVGGQNPTGYYWVSKPYSASEAYYISFDRTRFYTGTSSSHCPRANGFSLRLAAEVD